MVLRFFFLLNFLFLWNLPVLVAQNTDEERLFIQAKTLRFTQPSKALKLLDYLQKVNDAEFSVEVGLEEMRVHRFLENFSSAVESSQKLQKKITREHSEMAFLHNLEQAFLFHDLSLDAEAEIILLKVTSLFNALPSELQIRHKNLYTAIKKFFEAKENGSFEDILHSEAIDKDVLSFILAKENILYDSEKAKTFLNNMSLTDSSAYLFKMKLVYEQALQNPLEVIKALQQKGEVPTATLFDLLYSEYFLQNEALPLEEEGEIWQLFQTWNAAITFDRNNARKLLLIQKYDEQQERSEIMQSERRKWLWFINVLLTTALLSYVVIKYIYGRKDKELLEAIEETSGKIMTDRTEEDLLEKLNSFEASKGFLNENLRLADLAKKLHTNTRYLSTVINTHKGKSFNSYLNTLRVAYVLQLLNENPQYLQYKISHLASECGFASQSSFSTAFKEYTGQSPSQYIKEMVKKSKG